MKSLLRILIVEDSLDDTDRLVLELESNGYNLIYKKVDTSTFRAATKDNIADSELDVENLTPTDIEKWYLTHVERLDIAIEYLSNSHFDVVLLDLSLPDSAGLDAVKKLQAIAPEIPVIVLTGYEDREHALQTVALGAQDYLVKGQISAPLLERAIRYAIERKKAEAQLIKALEQERELNQLKLIHNEKMASLGQLVASVAHELSNPINFIYANIIHVDNYAQDLLALIDLYQQGYAHTASEILDKIEEIDLGFIRDDMPKTMSSMKMGTERISELVLTLRNFSRLDDAQMKPVNIHEGLDSALLILRDRLKEKAGHPAIEVIKEYGNLPLVECYAGQLNQVFLNIISNAIDALCQKQPDFSEQVKPHQPATIKVRTRVLNNNRVEISIKDDGPGIAESVKAKIFDPFFTTKEVGKGTGLGLSISYQIVVEKHLGQMQCRSQPGQGAEFLIEIPIRQSD
ncbi:MAG TPA: hybrid sensor histidine kinase/response regulator [Cyanobacteria bacterium UBA8553]|nr:hybrid sensor histidine kinase/response regulator [Cyanobacteria bacterium UBA8553]HAJ64343.1 hybrid sensor histidine kinase/response regulator [Cyanobacteria bacterium UBA8543]